MPWLIHLATWLKTTQISAHISGSMWIWPAAETLHFMGLAMLLGVVGTIDLRILGMAKGLRFEPLHRMLPWGIAGFVVNLVTGVVFFIGQPQQYVTNQPFFFKLLFIVLAGLNVAAFYATGLFRQTESMGPGDDAPLGAKVIAGVSIFLWFGVIFWGRMLPYLGDSF